MGDIIWVPNKTPVGVCLWKMPSGGFLSDGEGYLSMEGPVGDKEIEKKMRESACYWTGNIFGEPAWFPGYRQVSRDEYEDQMARLQEGKIPDPIDAYRQATGEA